MKVLLLLSLGGCDIGGMLYYLIVCYHVAFQFCCYHASQSIFVLLKSCGSLSLSLFFSQNLLYNELLTFRGQLAHEAGIAPFLVGNNRLLGELAKTR